MRKVFSFLLISFFVLQYLSAQLEGVRVEVYYVSDSNDATDVSGGNLPAGSVTYRVFADMAPGSKLRSVYGDENHKLSFSSQAGFFNHSEDGVSFANDMNKNRLDEGIIFLDSWITIGQVSSNGVHVALPKASDFDGQEIAGTENEFGLLTNFTSEMEYALTDRDGLTITELTALPAVVIGGAFLAAQQGGDSTIFNVSGITHFESDDAEIFLLDGNAERVGIQGVVEEENEVIIAQLTTLGEDSIAFNINLEIEFEENGESKIVKYVSSSDVLLDGEEFNSLLSYPWECGCKDPDFLEADLNFACSDPDACQTPIVIGCMDPNACNYDEDANFNIEDLCCYVGYCNDRDISIVCQDLPEFRQRYSEDQITLYPNPADQYFKANLDFDYLYEVPLTIYDALGRERMQAIWSDHDQEFDISDLETGIYTIRFMVDDSLLTKSIFIF